MATKGAENLTVHSNEKERSARIREARTATTSIDGEKYPGVKMKVPKHHAMTCTGIPAACGENRDREESIST